jgi:hypothetical protein
MLHEYGVIAEIGTSYEEHGSLGYGDERLEGRSAEIGVASERGAWRHDLML